MTLQAKTLSLLRMLRLPCLQEALTASRGMPGNQKAQSCTFPKARLDVVAALPTAGHARWCLGL